MNTHGLVIDFGRHKGELYTRVPVNYLLWMVNSNHYRAVVAQAELDRRGTVLPKIEISGHAIDRASLMLLKAWKENTKKEVGLHAWLCKISEEAYKKGIDKTSGLDVGISYYMGIKFVFQLGQWPVLKTVMPKKIKNEANN
jgi:hypothetical protein